MPLLKFADGGIILHKMNPYPLIMKGLKELRLKISIVLIQLPRVRLDLEKWVEEGTFFRATHLVGKKLLRQDYDSIAIRDVGDAYNHSDKELKLPKDNRSQLHPFLSKMLAGSFFNLMAFTLSGRYGF